MTTLGRFTVLTSLPLAPGCCWICSKAECARGFLDTGRSDEWIGATYVCADCAGEMASLLGMITAERAEQLVLAAADATSRLGQLRALVAAGQQLATQARGLAEQLEEWRESADDGRGPAGGDDPGGGSDGTGGGARRRRGRTPVPAGGGALRPPAGPPAG